MTGRIMGQLQDETICRLDKLLIERQLPSEDFPSMEGRGRKAKISELSVGRPLRKSSKSCKFLVHEFHPCN